MSFSLAFSTDALLDRRSPTRKITSPSSDQDEARLVTIRAERVVVIGAIALRAIFVTQLALSMPDSVTHATRPAVFIAASALALTESLFFAAALWRRQRFSPRLAVFDIAVMTALVLGEPIYTAPGDRVGTWVAWAFPAAMAAAVSAGLGLRRLPMTVAAGAVITVAYVVVSVPAAMDSGMAATAWTNAVAIMGFALVARLIGQSYLAMARVADDARRRAALAAAAAELERQRGLLHDQATVLTLLARTDVSPEQTDALRRQAAAMSKRIRSFLASEPRLGGRDGTVVELGLEELLSEVLEQFPDLPVTANLDLARSVSVGTAQAGPLSAALETLLQNVRCHADASAVVVHGDRVDGRWELIVRDDGIGFDPASVKRGYGLSVQAGSALREVGIDVTVESAAGEGTGVTLSGPIDEEQS